MKLAKKKKSCTTWKNKGGRYKRTFLPKHASKEKQVLSYIEQDTLRQTIRQIFAEYIAELQNENPDLKEEDIYMLCLREYGLTYAQIAQCFGHTDPQVFIQRNYRLKKQKENKTVPNNNSQN